MNFRMPTVIAEHSKERKVTPLQKCIDAVIITGVIYLSEAVIHTYGYDFIINFGVVRRGEQLPASYSFK